MPNFYLVCTLLAGYLVGSISSAVLTCKLMGLPDPRTQGSGNPGATNVLRIGGKKAGLITFACDFLKGFLPVLIGKSLGLDSVSLSLLTLATFLGHLYPIFFRFQGGKGVATAAGCLLALSWPVGLALILTWLATALVFRYSSLAALTAALGAPFFTYYLAQGPYTLMSVVMSGFLIYRHRRNIHNLWQGREDKIGTKKKTL